MLVVLVTVDCGRADHMDGSRGLTPRLDSFRDQGTTFTQAFAQSQSTLSSHLTMLTSNYLFQHGVYSNYTPRRLPEHALPRRLEALGWTCRAWAGARFLARALADSMGEVDPRFPFAGEPFWRRTTRGLFRRRDRVTAASTFRAALDWLDSECPSGDRFVWLHLFDTHMVYHAPRVFLREQLPRARTGVSCRAQIEANGWYCTEHPAYRWRVSPEYFPARYRAAIRYVDDCVGRFVADLKARSWWDDVLFVLTADHGECLQGDHGLYCMHKKLFDTTVHVPLWIRFPEGAHAGKFVDSLVELVDIAPTVASTAGFNEPLYMGHDLALVAAGRHPGRAFVFSEHVDNSFRAVRDRRFIWIERPRESLEPSGFPIEEERLFLRDGTPAAGSFQAEAERLRGAVVSLMGSRPEVQNAWQPGPPIDDATVNHLIRLGYLQPPGPKAGQVRSR